MADRVPSGNSQVAAAGQTMTELVRSVQQVSTLIREISVASAVSQQPSELATAVVVFKLAGAH